MVAASGNGVFHTNRKPLSFMKKLRPKNPCLAVIEEAQVPSMAIIAGFCHDRLPTTDSAFESLSNSMASPQYCKAACFWCNHRIPQGTNFSSPKSIALPGAKSIDRVSTRTE